MLLFRIFTLFFVFDVTFRVCVCVCVCVFFFTRDCTAPEIVVVVVLRTVVCNQYIVINQLAGGYLK
jgi:hypothetical protein